MLDYTKLRTTMRYIAATSSVILSLGAGTAFAHIDISGENHLTGSGSDNDNVHVITDDVDIEVENEAEVSNDATVDVDAGGNVFEDNTTIEDIETGEVEVVGSFDTTLNDESSIDLGDVEPLHVDADFSNDTTGSASDNDNTLVVDRDIDVEVENEAEVSNSVDLDANTGGNAVRRNTTVGNFTSGDVMMDVDVQNHLNAGGSSSMDLGGLTDTTVSVDASNDTTGSGSANTNTTTVSNDVDVEIENEAEITNTFTANTTTGGNAVEDNTTVGNVKTGSVNINFSSTNHAN